MKVTEFKSANTVNIQGEVTIVEEVRFIQIFVNDSEGIPNILYVVSTDSLKHVRDTLLDRKIIVTQGNVLLSSNS